MFEYLTNCVSISQEDVPALEEMMDKSVETSFGDFREAISDTAYSNFVEEMGYGDWLSLEDDWAVRFYKSTFEDKPCVYCVHSAIEYIFADVSYLYA